MVTPTIGRVVLYCLSEQDAEQINRRRTTGHSIAERIREAAWPVGAQAHIGTTVYAGDVCPGIVVRVWNEDCINIQVLLDGNDVLWATWCNVSDEPTPGRYHWMPYQKGQAAKAEALDVSDWQPIEELQSVLRRLCDEIENTNLHGGGADDDACPLCNTLREARELLAHNP